MDDAGFTEAALSSSGRVQSKTFIEFGLHPKQDEQASIDEGRPIFREVEYIKILVPGDKDNVVHRPVRPSDKQQYREQYKHWKEGTQDASSGTPLSKWPGLSRAEVEELAYFNVRTVEQLAEMSDANVARFMGVVRMRQRARDYLEAARGEAPLSKVRAELEKRDLENDTLRRALAEQGQRIAQLEAAGRVPVPAPAPAETPKARR